MKDSTHITKHMLKESLLNGEYLLGADIQDENVIIPQNVFHFQSPDIPGLAALYIYTLSDTPDQRYDLTCVDRRRIPMKDISTTIDAFLNTIDEDYDLCFTLDPCVFRKIGEYSLLPT